MLEQVFEKRRADMNNYFKEILGKMTNEQKKLLLKYLIDLERNNDKPNINKK